jgi:virulence factor Mce-like protein
MSGYGKLRGSTALGRIAAVAALGVAAVVVVLLLGGGDGDEYEVTAEFENASQLVGDEQVTVGGIGVGTVKSIELGDDGSALVTFTVDDEHAPLQRGTVATIRSQSLASIANRQIQLTLPAEADAGAEIASGETLSRADTVSEVDLDQLFNTLDPETIEDFKHVIQGFEISYDGVGKQANRGFQYLNPFLSTSRRLFGELNRDQRTLERLIVDTSKLSGALAARAPDVSALVANLDSMMNAIGSRSAELSEGVAKLPQFMREANTTFVNLRAALDDLDPLVEASRPAARELGPFLAQLREAAADAVPTIRDLDEDPPTTWSSSPACRCRSPRRRSARGRPSAAAAISPTPPTAPATTTTPRAPSASRAARFATPPRPWRCSAPTRRNWWGGSMTSPTRPPSTRSEASAGSAPASTPSRRRGPGSPTWAFRSIRSI